MKQPARIVILGGGYVAIFACRALRKAIERGEVDVTVVSRENYRVWHGYVSEMITGRIAAGQILSPARRIFQPARVHVAEIEAIDLAQQKVVTSRHLDGRHYELDYDHLILALGSAEHLDAYPGLAEHGFRLKSYDDCFRLKNPSCGCSRWLTSRPTVRSGAGCSPSSWPGAATPPRGDRGRVLTEPSMRVPGSDNLWAGGDCAAVPHVRGGTCPPVGTYAMEMGTHIGRNILRQMAGQEIRPFTWPGLGPFPSWDRKLRLLSDWLVWPLVGRDIVEMSVDDGDDYEIHNHVYQPGEVILEAGQMGRYIYLITEGEVEAVRPGGERTVLGPGSYFGHTQRNRRSQETIAALTVVKAVTVRHDQAHRLHQALGSLSGAVAGD